MKLSNYNFILYDSKYSYWFNALTHRFFRLSIALGKKLELRLNNYIEIEKKANVFWNKLKECGFLIDDGIDELSIIRQNNDFSIHNKDYFLIILPTLNCNFSCWYCIQSHIPSKMSEQTLESIKRHIDYMIECKRITSLHLDWFGGEPFMYFKNIIHPISIYAKEKCLQFNIPFTNSSTTNGFFLSKTVSEQLSDLKFSHFQITLDGEKTFHDKVKFQKGCQSAFDNVLNNINTCLDINKELKIYLRINYTHKTLTQNIVNEVNQIITKDNRNRIVITPKKVWQEKVDKNFMSKLVEILDLFAVSGYKVSLFAPSSSFIPCYANKEYYSAINFNGNVVKCTACNDIYKKVTHGKLDNNGIIVWDKNFEKRYQCKSYENEKCLKCKKLPICMGVCPRDFIIGNTYCKYDSEDINLQQSIINYIKYEYE